MTVKCYLKPPHQRVNVAEGDYRRIFIKKEEPFEVEEEEYNKILEPKGLFVSEEKNEGNIILAAMKRAIDEGRVTKAGLPRDDAIDEYCGFEVSTADRERMLPSLPEAYMKKMKAFKKNKR